jgi:hypothetical protein
MMVNQCRWNSCSPFTSFAGIRRTSWPSFVNSRAQWCDVAQDSMPIRHGGKILKKGDHLAASQLPSSPPPLASMPHTSGGASGGRPCPHLEHVARLIEAAQGQVDPAADMEPISGLLDQGCDLEADILPTVARTVPELPRPLTKRSAPWLVQEILPTEWRACRYEVTDSQRRKNEGNENPLVVGSTQAVNG